jgi:hypothetical protein
MPVLLCRIRARYQAWRSPCHNRTCRQENRAWDAGRYFGASGVQPGLRAQQQEGAKTEFLNRRSQRSLRSLFTRAQESDGSLEKRFKYIQVVTARRSARTESPATRGREDGIFQQKVAEISEEGGGRLDQGPNNSILNLDCLGSLRGFICV